MASAFPSFPGLGLAVERSESFNTGGTMSPSRKRNVLAWQNTQLRSWKISLDVLRQYGSFAEVASILTHFRACKGKWDSFNFTDPYDSSTVLCAYDTDTLTMTQLASGSWEVKELRITEVF